MQCTTKGIELNLFDCGRGCSRADEILNNSHLKSSALIHRNLGSHIINCNAWGAIQDTLLLDSIQSLNCQQ